MFEFDYVGFFERNNIYYNFDSPNAGRGEVAIKCPMCGSADPSQHMSVNLKGRGWVCRRDRDHHRGVAPHRLICALTGCSAEEANRIVGAPLLPGEDSFLGALEKLLGGNQPAPAEAPPRGLREPREFRRFAGKPSSRPFVRYMRGRGFSAKFLERMSAEAGLRYCTLGVFAGRVIFLVEMEGRLVTWTGRSISSRAKRRYHAHTPDPELAGRWGLEPAARSVESCLLWYDDLLGGGELLEVVEGPMDALKLRMLGRSATCLFTNRVSDGQVDLLRELAPRFERRAVLLDRGAEAQAFEAASRLAALKFELEWLPRGVADPGELSADLVYKIEY